MARLIIQVRQNMKNGYENKNYVLVIGPKEEKNMGRNVYSNVCYLGIRVDVLNSY